MLLLMYAMHPFHLAHNYMSQVGWHRWLYFLAHHVWLARRFFH